MYKGFLEFVGTEHPDPDSLLGNDYVFNELVKLADNYCEKQLLIQRVVLQSEQLNKNKTITLPKVEPSKVRKSNEGVD
jgi:hypothetical protein